MKILKYQYGGKGFLPEDEEDVALDITQLKPNANQYRYDNPIQRSYERANGNSPVFQFNVPQQDVTNPNTLSPRDVRREARQNNREVRQNNRALRQMAKNPNDQYRLNNFNRLEGNVPSFIQQSMMEKKFNQDPTQGFTTMEDRHNLPVQGGWRPLSYQEGGSALPPWATMPMPGSENTSGSNRFDRKEARLENQQARLNLRKANLYRKMEGLPRIKRDYTAADGFVHPLEYLDPTPPGYVEPGTTRRFKNNPIERRPSNVV